MHQFDCLASVFYYYYHLSFKVKIQIIKLLIVVFPTFNILQQLFFQQTFSKQGSKLTSARLPEAS